MEVIKGTVVNVEHRQQSIVSGGSEGGFVTTLPDGRVVGLHQPINISTEVVSQDIVWIKTEAGNETDFRLNGDSFSCREGHRVGFIFGEKYIYSAHNFTTNRTTRYFNKESITSAFTPVRDKSSAPVFIAMFFAAIGVGGVAVAASEGVTMNPLWLSGLFLIGPVLWFVSDHKKDQEFKAKQVKAGQEAVQFSDCLESLEARLIS